MAIRKLETIHDLEELNFRPDTLMVLKAANVDVQDLITTARYNAQQLLYYPGVGGRRANDIVQAIDEAGFILHESERSRCARRLLTAVLGSSAVLSAHYEDLEDMAPEALEAVEELVQEALPDRELQVIELRFGLKDGQCHTPQECADALDMVKERVRQLESKALARLRHPSYCSKLEVITCYSRGALACRMAELWSDIDKLQLELNALQNGNPYPEFRDARVGGMPIKRLDPSVRTYNCLTRAGIHTVGELIKYTEEDLLEIRNFGTKGVEEVCELLRRVGLTLAS